MRQVYKFNVRKLNLLSFLKLGGQSDHTRTHAHARTHTHTHTHTQTYCRLIAKLNRRQMRLAGKTVLNSRLQLEINVRVLLLHVRAKETFGYLDNKFEVKIILLMPTLCVY